MGTQLLSDERAVSELVQRLSFAQNDHRRSVSPTKVFRYGTRMCFGFHLHQVDQDLGPVISDRRLEDGRLPILGERDHAPIGRALERGGIIPEPAIVESLEVEADLGGFFGLFDLTMLSSGEAMTQAFLRSANSICGAHC
jgi:hypothetical protein